MFHTAHCMVPITNQQAHLCSNAMLTFHQLQDVLQSKLLCWFCSVLGSSSSWQQSGRPCNDFFDWNKGWVWFFSLIWNHLNFTANILWVDSLTRHRKLHMKRLLLTIRLFWSPENQGEPTDIVVKIRNSQLLRVLKYTFSVWLTGWHILST